MRRCIQWHHLLCREAHRVQSAKVGPTNCNSHKRFPFLKGFARVLDSVIFVFCVCFPYILQFFDALGLGSGPLYFSETAGRAKNLVFCKGVKLGQEYSCFYSTSGVQTLTEH